MILHSQSPRRDVKPMPEKASIASMVARDIPQSKFELVVHPVKCTGCGSCELICSLYHDGVNSPSLSRIRVVRDVLSGENSIQVCAQCQGPECMQACPVEKAMVVDEKSGARLIVEEECIGCGNCFRACPFNVEGSIIKHRPKENVVEICPQNALSCIEHR